jgi:hypothetical protein
MLKLSCSQKVTLDSTEKANIPLLIQCGLRQNEILHASFVEQTPFRS